MLSLLPLFAQIHNGGGFEWSIQNILLAIIVIAGAVGVVLILLKVFNVQIPGWVVQIFWVVLAVVVGVFAIKLIFSMW